MKDYESQTTLAEHMLNVLVDRDLAYLIAKDSLDTPKKWWDELKHHFEWESTSYQIQLLTQLLAIKMTPKMSMDQYYKDFQDLTM